MKFEPNKDQEDLIAMMREARTQQEESFEAARVTLRENSEKQPESDYPDKLIPSGFPKGSLSPEDLALIDEQIILRRLAKADILSDDAKTLKALKEHNQVICVVGGNQMGRGLITARLIESLKDHNHQVILVDGGDAGKLYGKEADRMVIDSLVELGNDRFNEKMLRAMSSQLETVPPYKKRKKGRNKSSFPGSGHY